MLTYAERTVPTFDGPGGKQKGFISPNVSLVFIKEVRADGWARGTYPIAGGKRVERWFKMADIQGYANFENYVLTVDYASTVYRTVNQNSNLGTVASGEKVLVVGETGDNYKIIYRVSGGNEYKMGYLPKTYGNGGYDDYGGNGGDSGGRGPTINGNVYLNVVQSQGDYNQYGNIDNSTNDNSITDNRVYDKSRHNTNIVTDNSVTDNSINTNINRTDNSINTNITNTDNSRNNITNNGNAAMNGAREFNGHRYKVVDEGKSWSAAKAYCESVGGHLATIASAAEQQFVQDLANKNGQRNCYWLGGYKDNGNMWRWVDGGGFGYTHWAKGEPSGGNERHIMLYAVTKEGSGNLGEWNDLPESAGGDFFALNNFGFVCEWD